jgi:hypothetical protein
VSYITCSCALSIVDFLQTVKEEVGISSYATDADMEDIAQELADRQTKLAASRQRISEMGSSGMASAIVAHRKEDLEEHSRNKFQERQAQEQMLRLQQHEFKLLIEQRQKKRDLLRLHESEHSENLLSNQKRSDEIGSLHNLLSQDSELMREAPDHPSNSNTMHSNAISALVDSDAAAPHSAAAPCAGSEVDASQTHQVLERAPLQSACATADTAVVCADDAASAALASAQVNSTAAASHDLGAHADAVGAEESRDHSPPLTSGVDSLSAEVSTRVDSDAAAPHSAAAPSAISEVDASQTHQVLERAPLQSACATADTAVVCADDAASAALASAQVNSTVAASHDLGAHADAVGAEESRDHSPPLTSGVDSLSAEVSTRVDSDAAAPHSAAAPCAGSEVDASQTHQVLERAPLQSACATADTAVVCADDAASAALASAQVNSTAAASHDLGAHADAVGAEESRDHSPPLTSGVDSLSAEVSTRVDSDAAAPHSAAAPCAGSEVDASQTHQVLERAPLQSACATADTAVVCADDAASAALASAQVNSTAAASHDLGAHADAVGAEESRDHSPPLTSGVDSLSAEVSTRVDSDAAAPHSAAAPCAGSEVDASQTHQVLERAPLQSACATADTAVVCADDAASAALASAQVNSTAAASHDLGAHADAVGAEESRDHSPPLTSGVDSLSAEVSTRVDSDAAAPHSAAAPCASSEVDDLQTHQVLERAYLQSACTTADTAVVCADDAASAALASDHSSPLASVVAPSSSSTAVCSRVHVVAAAPDGAAAVSLSAQSFQESCSTISIDRSIGQCLDSDDLLQATSLEWDSLFVTGDADSSNRLKRLWRSVDDGNGKVSLAELDSWFLRQYPNMHNKAVIKQAFAMSKTQQGFITFNVFKQSLVNIIRCLRAWDAWDAANQALDVKRVDNGGKATKDHRLEYKEFKRFFFARFPGSIERVCKLEWQAMDADAKGMVLFGEFCNWYISKAATGLSTLKSHHDDTSKEPSPIASDSATLHSQELLSSGKAPLVPTNTDLNLGDSRQMQQQAPDNELQIAKAEVERLKAEIEKLKGRAAFETENVSQEMEAESRVTSLKDGDGAPSPRSIVVQATRITVERVSCFAFSVTAHFFSGHVLAPDAAHDSCPPSDGGKCTIEVHASRPYAQQLFQS